MCCKRVTGAETLQTELERPHVRFVPCQSRYVHGATISTDLYRFLVHRTFLPKVVYRGANTLVSLGGVGILLAEDRIGTARCLAARVAGLSPLSWCRFLLCADDVRASVSERSGSTRTLIVECDEYSTLFAILGIVTRATLPRLVPCTGRSDCSRGVRLRSRWKSGVSCGGRAGRNALTIAADNHIKAWNKMADVLVLTSECARYSRTQGSRTTQRR